LERIGTVAYKLQLPSEAKIHPVFHVSQLREYKGDVSSIVGGVPVLWEESSVHPIAILDRQMRKKGNGAGTYLLVQWHGAGKEAATWEEYTAFVKHFPTFDLEGAVVS
jgi:hypothetical protein